MECAKGCRARRETIVGHESGQSDVADLREGAVMVQQNIVRLQVAMNHLRLAAISQFIEWSVRGMQTITLWDKNLHTLRGVWECS